MKVMNSDNSTLNLLWGKNILVKTCVSGPINYSTLIFYAIKNGLFGPIFEFVIVKRPPLIFCIPKAKSPLA
jgi:hypothetical protein